MVFKQIIKILTLPFRRMARLFRGGARETGAAVKATTNTSAGSIAKAIPDDLLENEYKEEPPTGIEAALFTQLPRPRLTERSATDLTLEQATAYSKDARGFYGFKFPLFTRGDFFYEEVEEDFLNKALGFQDNSIDQRFLDVTTLFRRTLNDNTRRMLLYWTPILFVLSFGAAYFLDKAGFVITGPKSIGGVLGPAETLYVAASIVGAALAFLIYSWPYKVVQQRNLMNLDNYTTSKFARINNNFQVAKRRALNVERDKRMSQREELKDEAGAWTLAYHWFAMRLMLCELVIRNKFYQVRRNTTLYWVAGLGLTMCALAVLLIILLLDGAAGQMLATVAGAGGAYFLIVAAIMRRATPMMFSVLEANEWSRFHLIGLDLTIRDHVGEDKLQIVTFRDRNRFE